MPFWFYLVHQKEYSTVCIFGCYDSNWVLKNFRPKFYIYSLNGYIILRSWGVEFVSFVKKCSAWVPCHDYLQFFNVQIRTPKLRLSYGCHLVQEKNGHEMNQYVSVQNERSVFSDAFLVLVWSISWSYFDLFYGA